MEIQVWIKDDRAYYSEPVDLSGVLTVPCERRELGDAVFLEDDAFCLIQGPDGWGLCDSLDAGTDADGIFEDISAAINVLKPGTYPVYHGDGERFDQFEVTV